MKLKVTKRYVDRYSKKIVEDNTILDNVSDGRAKELIAQKVAEQYTEKAAKAEPEKKG